MVLLAAGCAAGVDDAQVGQAGDGSGRPLVLATTSIWADVVANVACDGLAVVESIMPAGADAHSFEPSLAARGRMQDADLVVANGLGLEESLAPTLGALSGDGVPVLEIGPHLTEPDGSSAPGGGADGHHADDDHDDGGPGGLDPHVWFDPVRVAAGLDVLADALVGDVGLDAEAVAGCVVSYRDELERLDDDIRRSVGTVPADDRLLVTNHDAFGTFAARYGLEVIGTVLPAATTLAEANPAALADLASLVEQHQVRAIFTEESFPDRDARALSERIEHPVAVVPLFTESLGPDGSGAETYVGMLRTNATRIVEALTEG